MTARTSVLEWMVGRVRVLDDWLRRSEFKVNRTIGGRLDRVGISRHSVSAVALPALLTVYLVNGPALRPSARLVMALLSGLLAMAVFAAALRWNGRRQGSITGD